MSQLRISAYLVCRMRLSTTCCFYHKPQHLFPVKYHLVSILSSNTFSTSTALCADGADKSQTEDEKRRKQGEEHSSPEIDTHFRLTKRTHPLGKEFSKEHNLKVPDSYWDNPVPHQIYSNEELQSVQQKHKEPQQLYEKVAMFAVKVMRLGFDLVSRYKGPGGLMTKRAWINRCLFLETVAGVPGMVAGMARHLKSLRSMKRDHGWIHTLLAEAENERMHLLIFMKMKDPSMFFRIMVIVGQGVFFNAFFITYLVSPRTCHRFVGYLEEEAVKTYTGLLKDMGEEGHLANWGMQKAHPIAINYYKLPPDSRVKDVIACVRADEATHRDVNHTFAGLDPELDPNPFLHKHNKQ